LKDSPSIDPSSVVIDSINRLSDIRKRDSHQTFDWVLPERIVVQDGVRGVLKADSSRSIGGAVVKEGVVDDNVASGRLVVVS